MEWKLTWFEQAIPAVVQGRIPRASGTVALGPTWRGGRHHNRLASIVNELRSPIAG